MQTEQTDPMDMDGHYTTCKDGVVREFVLQIILYG